MLTSKRYSFTDLLLWTRFETFYFFLYALVVTGTYSLCGFSFLHVPWTPLALIGTAVAFVIGFQNNAAYERIWEARKIWGEIVNQSRILAMQIQDFVRTSESEDSRIELKKIHHVLVLRHVGWLTAMRHSMREPRRWEMTGLLKTEAEWSSKIAPPESKSTLQADLTPYLPLSELDYVLSKGNRPSAILFLQSRHLRKLKEQGKLWEFAFLQMEGSLAELFNLQGKSERIKNFPYPRQYSTISHWFVIIFLALLPFALIPEFQEIGEKLNDVIPSTQSYFVWAAVPFCSLVSWVFYTMEKIGRSGENPFEGSPNDVPISTIARGIEIDILQQHNFDQKEIPPPFNENFFVQM